MNVSILGHLKFVCDPVGFRTGPPKVHLVDLRCYDSLKVSGVLCHLIEVLFPIHDTDGPSSIEIRDQVHTFGMVYTKFLPAVGQICLQEESLL